MPAKPASKNSLVLTNPPASLRFAASLTKKRGASGYLATHHFFLQLGDVPRYAPRQVIRPQLIRSQKFRADLSALPPLYARVAADAVLGEQ